MSSRPTLTIKEIQLIKGMVAGKTPADSLRAHGDYASYGSAATVASRMLKKVDVQEALAAAFKKHGITIDAAVAPIGKALKATKVQITGQGDQAFAEVVEDLDLQLKASDRALKLMGVGKEDPGGNTYNFVQITQALKDKYAD